MTRLLSFVLLGLVLFVSAAAVVLYLAYGMDTSYPDELVTPAVSGETTIGWYPEHTRIEAPDEAALYAGLGYVHGLRRTWPAHLLRQVALGRTSEWYGPATSGIDSLSLQLGLATSSRSAMRMLPDTTRRLLEAYSEGVNLAMRSRSARLQDEFTVLGITPEPWEPWHSLAIERLFAWVGTGQMPDSLLAGAPEEVRVLSKRSEAMRELLAMHDLDHSAVFLTDGPAPMFGVRIAYGSAVMPILEEHEIVLNGRRRIAAILVGTPFPFVIAETSRAAAVLPGGRVRIRTTLQDTLSMTASYERIADRQGREVVISFLRGEGQLFLTQRRTRQPVDTLATATQSADTSQVTPDTLITRRDATERWMLDWHGIDAGSDAVAFADLLRGGTSSFSLFRGGAIMVGAGGNVAVSGSDHASASVAGATVVGHPTWVGPLAERLSVLQTMADSVGMDAMMDDVHSAWAESMLPTMVRAASSIPDPPPAVRDALTYLRNWNHEYDGANIAASIFDAWVRAYRDSTGALPIESADDSLFTERYLRYQLLAGVVDSMTQRYGPEMSQWRWERTRPDRRYVPGFPPDGDWHITTNRRYDPLDLAGRGHPSTIQFGTTPLDDMPAGGGAWEAWAPRSSLDSLTVRRRRMDVSSFRGRYMIPEGSPPLMNLGASPPERTTVLLPPRL